LEAPWREGSPGCGTWEVLVALDFGCEARRAVGGWDTGGFQRELFKLEIIVDFIERRERTGPLQEGLHVVILGVETTKDIEDEGAVSDDLTKIA